jgi:hypothetical protein
MDPDIDGHGLAITSAGGAPGRGGGRGRRDAGRQFLMARTDRRPLTVDFRLERFGVAGTDAQQNSENDHGLHSRRVRPKTVEKREPASVAAAPRALPRRKMRYRKSESSVCSRCRGWRGRVSHHLTMASTTPSPYHVPTYGHMPLWKLNANASTTKSAGTRAATHRSARSRGPRRRSWMPPSVKMRRTVTGRTCFPSTASR